MKKAILLLPLLILAGSIAGILFLEKDEVPVEETTSEEQKNEIQTYEQQTITFDQKINNYFSLSAASATEHEKMRVYPIVGNADYLKDHAELGNFLNLSEALQSEKVRIMEVGEIERERQPDIVFNPNPFNNNSVIPQNIEPDSEVGRAYSSGATVNTLTIENLSTDPIYIMAGDVIQGGRQDRVIAEDMIVMPNSGKVAIPVFCVESSRWSYRNKPSNVKSKKDEEQIFAFTGYFNVASNSIRQTVKHEKDQGEVWSKVGEMRSRHNVASNSSTYGDLVNSKSFIKLRNEYLEKFETIFDNSNNVVGCLVVSGNEVLGCDMFATPELFKKQYKVLLHAYITEAVTYGKIVKMSDEKIEEYFEASFDKYFEKQKEEKEELELKFVHQDRIVHFTDI